VSTELVKASNLWLLLAGRALYSTGVALQAAMSSDNANARLPQASWRHFQTATELFPQQLLHLLQDCVAQLGGRLQQLAASDGKPAVQGSKQLRVVLGRPVLEAYTQLTAACEAAVCRASMLVEQQAVQLWYGGSRDDAPTRDLISLAWRQLRTDEGRVLVNSLLSFTSLLCAALPTQLCCNEPSCCCFDKPSELQLAVGKGSQCSRCGAARYCGTADQSKHWKQQKPICTANAAAMAAQAAVAQSGAEKKQRRGKMK
jgi:hypothetical protein